LRIFAAVNELADLEACNMMRLYAQGDILIERVDAAAVSGEVICAAAGGSVIVAAGEATGHKHRLVGTFTWYRDDALARDIPDGLYVGHVQVLRPAAQVTHEEHGPLALDAGTYRLRRQRQLEPTDVGPSEHSDRVED
jgi:hypothetical protein